MLKPLYFFALFIFCFFQLTGQDDYIVTTDHFNMENGLAGQFANYTFRDSRGIIWMGTQQGLHRYDGRDIKIFDSEHGLPFPQIMEIYEDAQGYFWLYRSCFSKNEDYCTKALAFFHPVTFEVKTFSDYFSHAPFEQEDIEFITSSTSREFFYVRAKGLHYLWSAIQGFQQLNTPYNVFMLFDNGNIGATEKNNSFFNYILLDQAGKELYQETLSNDTLPSNYFYTFPSKPPYRYNLRNSIFFSAPDGRFHIYTPDSEGKLDFNEQLSIEAKLVNKHARHTFYDEVDHAYWSADRGGIIRTHIQKKKFHHFSSNDNDVTQIYTCITPVGDNKLIIAGWGNGPEIYEKTANASPQLIAYLKNDHELVGSKKIRLAGKSALLNAKKVHALTRSEILVVSEDGSYKVIPVEEILPEHKENPESIQVVTIINQQLWIGSHKQLIIYDIASDRAFPFPKVNHFNQLSNSSIHCIQAIDKGNYWIGTNKGLFLLSLEEGVIAQYGPEQTGAYHMPLSTVYHVTQARDGSFWLATRTGLVHWQGPGTTSYKVYSKEEGLPDNYCAAVYQDQSGFLWISSRRGIVQLDPNTDRLKIYNKKNGLPLEYFIEHGHYQDDHSGHIYFGGVKGYIQMNPEDFKDVSFDEPSIPLMIVDFEQYNQEYERFENKTINLIEDGKITLTPNGKIFSLRLALANYQGIDKQLFSYRILGYQEEWQEDRSNLIRISGLPYGNYVLQIKGRLSDGRYSSQQLNIPVRVLKPLYLQWWFIAIAVGIILLGAFAGYRWRILSLKKRQAVLEQTVQERTSQIEADRKTIELQAEELKALDKVKSLFFANISHELRTPLTLMLAPIEASLKNGKLEPRDIENLQIAQRNGQRLNQMVKEILSLAKLEAGKAEIKLQTINWYNFLQSIVALFTPLAIQKQIEFRFLYSSHRNLFVELDKGKVEIILNNLLSNAFKFTPKGGSILLNVEDSNGKFQLSVSDTGRGIAPTDLPRIFERFYQTQVQDASAEGGTGIGLALSHEYAQLLKGSLRVESELSKGSTFYLELPYTEVLVENILTAQSSTLVPPIVTTDTAPQQSASTPLKSKKHHILIVEDNNDLRHFLEKILSPSYHVLTAENGAEAIKLLEQTTSSSHPSPDVADKRSWDITTSPSHNITTSQYPSLIISDIMMPIMDGYQLLEKLKADERYRSIPVIMLTARADADGKLKAMRIGVDDYLTKPFVQEELIARINYLLQNAEQRQQAITEHKNDNNQATISLDLDAQAWLQTVEQTLLDNISSPSYTLDQLAIELNISKRQLQRRIKQYVGQTPNAYLRTLRLTKARNLLEEQGINSVKAASLSVGFKDVSYFSKQFKQAFGKLPSEYL